MSKLSVPVHPAARLTSARGPTPCRPRAGRARGRCRCRALRRPARSAEAARAVGQPRARETGGTGRGGDFGLTGAGLGPQRSARAALTYCRREGGALAFEGADADAHADPPGPGQQQHVPRPTLIAPTAHDARRPAASVLARHVLRDATHSGSRGRAEPFATCRSRRAREPRSAALDRASAGEAHAGDGNG